MRLRLWFFGFLALGITSANAWGSGEGAAVGASLREVPSARLSALADGVSALENDATVFSVNPAVLSTLQDNQFSFLYQKGMADDSFGQVVWGHQSGWGASFGMYDGGEVSLFNGTVERNVQAQKDLLGTVGYGRAWQGISLGMAVKYFSSELAETSKASALMADVGAQMPVGSRLRLGAAYQNLGGQMTYLEEKHPLPQAFRLGAALQIFQRHPTLIVAEVPYFIEEDQVSPTIGCEINFSPVVVRAGYKSGSDVESFQLGAGLILGQVQLDYSIGLVDNFDNRQRLSLLLHYGGRR